MNTFLRNSTFALVAAIVTNAAHSQINNEKPLTDKKEKTEEIIIRKKGDKTEKMTIVVDGDNVTINGKPADQFKNGDVTVLKRDRSFPMPPDTRRFQSGRAALDPLSLLNKALGHTNKAMLGILTEKTDNGVKVTDITKESGAEKAGLKKEDVITKIGSKSIANPAELVEVIGGYKPDDKVDITYLRSGKESKTTAILGENKSRTYSYNYNNNDDFHFNMPDGGMPNIENFDFNFNHKPRIGLQIQDVEEGKGVKVKDVDDNSPASKAGMKEGDIITQLNGKDVAGVDDLRDGIKDLKEGDAVNFGYKRDGKNQTAEIKIPKRLKSADL